MQPIVDALGQIVAYLNANYPAIITAVTSIVGELVILKAIFNGLLPLLQDLWDLLKGYFGFAAGVGTDVARVLQKPKG